MSGACFTPTMTTRGSLRPARSLTARRLELEIGRSVRDSRHATGWSQRELAVRSGASRSLVSKVELAAGNVSIERAVALLDALGVDVRLETRSVHLMGVGRQRDPGHARCQGYVHRRLQHEGWTVRREVEIGDGRSRGWIDLLGFHPDTGRVLVIEVKTEIDDLGRVERQIGWYEREAWAAARRLGWRPRALGSALLVLATEANDERIRINREALATAFPVRAVSLLGWLREPLAQPLGGRAVALVDPATRRADWLLRSRLDGRRSTTRYESYADFVRRAG